MPSNRYEGRSLGLDLARVLAVSLVVLYHAMAAQTTVLGRLGGAGWMGVDLFFVLSGFLVTRGFQAKLQASPPDGAGAPDPPLASAMGAFFRKRVRRIVPAYLATVVVISLMTLPILPLREKALGDLPYYLTFTANHHDIGAPVLWSISVEMQFYLLLPLAWFGGSGRRIADWVVANPIGSLGMALGVPLACRGLLFLLAPAIHGSVPQVFTPGTPAAQINTAFGREVYNSLFGHSDSLLLGTWLGLVWLEGGWFEAMVQRWKGWILALGAVWFLLAYEVLSPWRTWMPRPPLLGLLGFTEVGSSSLLLVVGLRATLGSVPGAVRGEARGAGGVRAAIEWVSDRIYSLYLGQAMASILLGFAVPWPALRVIPGLILSGLYVAVTVAFAIPLYNLVERRLSGTSIAPGLATDPAAVG